MAAWVHGCMEKDLYPLTLLDQNQISPCNINTLYSNRYCELIRA